MGRIGCVKDVFSVDSSATSKKLFEVAAWFRGQVTLSRHKKPLGTSALARPKQRSRETQKDSRVCSLYI